MQSQYEYSPALALALAESNHFTSSGALRRERTSTISAHHTAFAGPFTLTSIPISKSSFVISFVFDRFAVVDFSSLFRFPEAFPRLCPRPVFGARASRRPRFSLVVFLAFNAVVARAIFPFAFFFAFVVDAIATASGVIAHDSHQTTSSRTSWSDES